MKINRMLKKSIYIIMVLIMTFAVTTVSSLAYIERGSVKISGDSSYSLDVNGTANLNVTPYQENHYPGCGMPECPTVCGEKDCIVIVDGQKECVCAGTVMTTYEASVKVSSSDENVAKVSYKDGDVTIKALGAGTATITIDASFREYSDASKTVKVTVADSTPAPKPSDSGTGGGSSSGGGSGSSSSSGSSTSDTQIPKTTSSAVSTSSAITTGPAVSTGSAINNLVAPVFKDVTGWANDSIYYLANKGIVNGKTSDQFAPNDKVTRAEFVKIIAGIAGADVSKTTSAAFSDVNASAWYSQYVNWASQNGIVKGSDGKFGPEDSISRQDMAVMIGRYVENISKKQLEKNTSKVTFLDDCCIDSYAKDAVSMMQQAGIINGRQDNHFAPTESATRAEACKMLASMMKMLEK